MFVPSKPGPYWPQPYRRFISSTDRRGFFSRNIRICMGDDLQACRDALKPEIALYVGGMGARAKNFYNDFIKQFGYPEAAAKIQDAYLGGRRGEAIAAVPDALVDECSLVGSPDMSAAEADHVRRVLIDSGAKNYSTDLAAEYAARARTHLESDTMPKALRAALESVLSAVVNRVR